MSHEKVDQSFRQHYAELVASLCRNYGFQEIELIEDSVQIALLKAVDLWAVNGQPENPSGWLFRVARNETLMRMRSSKRQREILEANHHEDPAEYSCEQHPRLKDEVHDDLLRMIFVVCDPDIPSSSQIAFALKVLCGFGVGEISSHLFASEESVYKRLQRARRVLAKKNREITDLGPAWIQPRINTVRKVIYALFTEGHSHSQRKDAFSVELCDEAIRLASILSQHRLGNDPETLALVALMQLHRARMGSRQNADGGLVLLEEQDRSRWDKNYIALGLKNLANSASGDAFSRYHAEAAIAAEHCLAPSFAETRWDRIAELYLRLEQLDHSFLHRLNRAVAVAEHKAPEDGLALLSEIKPPTWLEGYYLWSAVLSDLNRRCGHVETAHEHRELALSLAPNESVRNALARRLEEPS